VGRALLRWVYTGRLEVEPKERPQLLEVARRLGMAELCAAVRVLLVQRQQEGRTEATQVVAENIDPILDSRSCAILPELRTLEASL
jgi:hypothetical protein